MKIMAFGQQDRSDPLDQSLTVISNKYYFHENSFCFAILGRMAYVKVVVATGRDCGLAEWINITIRKIAYLSCLDNHKPCQV